MLEDFTALKLERRGKVLVITLDNPPMNAVTAAMHTELSRVFVAANRDPDTKVVVVTGAGEKAFSAGGDIKNMLRRIEEQDHAEWIKGVTEGRLMIDSLLRLEKPLIARVNGHAMGMGSSIAVMSDFSYMMERAKIADTHVRVGLSAGDGGAFMWPLLMGFIRAKQYLLTGDAMSGKEAAQNGLITASAASIEELDAMTWEMAERLASGATLAINATKASVNLLLRKMLEGVMEAHLGAETYTYLSKDHHIAAKAFRDGEDPVFKGSKRRKSKRFNL